MAYGESNGHEIDGVTWPRKVNVMTRIYLGPIVSKTARDTDLVVMEHKKWPNFETVAYSSKLYGSILRIVWCFSVVHLDTDSDFIFTDEKVLHVTSPVNKQKDRVYVPRNVNKREIAAERLVRCRPIFPSRWWFQLSSQSWAVRSCSLLNLAWKWTAGVNVKSEQQMLPVMRRIAGDVFVFQQDSAPAHRVRETVQLLQQQTPEFIHRHHE